MGYVYIARVHINILLHKERIESAVIATDVTVVVHVLPTLKTTNAQPWCKHK
jgi:hypothetical protein